MSTTSPFVGQQAPDFTLTASHGRTISSASLKGKPYLLYFYPKANTPGCTTQACGIQEALPALSKLNLTVIGVSPDPIKAIDKFATKYGLEFPLASDPEHHLADQYDTWVLKKLYGREYWGMERSSFLVDAKGIIRHVWRKVKPAEHAAAVSSAAAQLE